MFILEKMLPRQIKVLNLKVLNIKLKKDTHTLHIHIYTQVYTYAHIYTNMYVYTHTHRIVASYPQGIYSKTPSGCLKLHLVLNPIHTVFPLIHAYLS